MKKLGTKLSQFTQMEYYQDLTCPLALKKSGIDEKVDIDTLLLSLKFEEFSEVLPHGSSLSLA